MLTNFVLNIEFICITGGVSALHCLLDAEIYTMPYEPPKLPNGDWDINHIPEDFMQNNPNYREEVSFRGIMIPWHYIHNLKWLSVKNILDETNVEVRRALMTMYWNGGLVGFLRDGGAEVIREREDYQLLKIEVPEEGELFVVKVVNRTIEPGAEEKTEEERLYDGLTKDGFKVYLLDIPEELEYTQYILDGNRYNNYPPMHLVKKFGEDAVKETTYRISVYDIDPIDAVGWTFGKHPGEYNPDCEA